MKKLVKSISMMLAIVYLWLIPFNASAAQSTEVLGSASPELVSASVTAADTALLNKWKGMGLLDGSTSTADLNQSVQKIDFITYINKILGTSKEAEISFSDVPGDTWYGKEIAKAVAAGYVENKDKAQFNPFTSISRLDAALILARAFRLELKDPKTLNKITDAEKLTPEELEAFGAVIEKGYLSEVSDGRYAPQGVIKLIDTMKMLDKSIGEVITKSGTITEDASGNMIVNASPVTLDGIQIGGDLIIGEGVLNGTVNLEKVTVKGNVIIRGGGSNGITIKNSKINGILMVEKLGGNVSVIAQGTTTIDQTLVGSGAKLSESGLTSGKGFVNVTFEQSAQANQTATLEGAYSNIELKNSNLSVKLNGNAENIDISKESTAYFTLQDGSVKNITTLASKGNILLEGGKVENLNVKSGAKGNKITVNGAVITGKVNIEGASTINFDKGTIEEIYLDTTSGGSYLNMKKDASLKTLNAYAAATVSGTGKLDKVNIYANNVNLDRDISPFNYTVAFGITAIIKGQEINSGTPTVYFTVDNMESSNKLTLLEGQTHTLAIGARNPSSLTLAYVSSDSNIATINKTGEIKGVSVGTTEVHVTGQFPGYNSRVQDIEVTVTSGNVTVPGTLTISPESGEAGSNVSLITLTYTPAAAMSNGTLVIKLPAGFSVNATDTIEIGSAEPKTLEPSQRPNSQTVTLTNLNLTAGQTVFLYLNNKIMPAGGDYAFTAIADADGYGPVLPTTGASETAVFSVNSLKQLVLNYNYKIPDPAYGSASGTMRITDLSFIGITTASDLKWLIKVQNGGFELPQYDDDLTNEGFVPYAAGNDIAVAVGQTIRLAVVDAANNKLKAYKDIAITDENKGWIRPADAAQLVSGVNYTPASGIKAGSVKIDGLNPTGTDTTWMYRVQNQGEGPVFVNTEFAGAPYTEGEDISVTANQHIILAEVAVVNGKNVVQAYADINAGQYISQQAVLLQSGNHFSAPVYGSAIGTTQIEHLNKGTLDITDWMYVLLAQESVVPGLNTSLVDFKRYTEGKDFTPYVQGENIPAAANEHLLLVGVKEGKIKAYAYMTLGSGQVRAANAPEIPDENIGSLKMGSKAFTTKLPSLSLTGSAILVDAEKFMYKVQNTGIQAPQMDSTLSGFSDCTAATDIKPGTSTVIVLLATDMNGRIKAYKNITVVGTEIRPADAPKFSTYRFEPGSALNSTTIVGLPLGGPSGITGTFHHWEYLIQNTQFDIPYLGSVYEGASIYPVGGKQLDNVSVNWHVLILAVNSDRQVLAYADEILNTDEIRQPSATEMQPKSIMPIGYHYTDPEPGLVGGSTIIKELNFRDIPAQKWYYKISNDSLTAPNYDSGIPAGFKQYNRDNNKESVEAIPGQYFVLLAVDSNNRVKAYANILLSESNISLPMLKTPLNYTNSIGSEAGTTKLTGLAFTGLASDTSGWVWMYAVGGNTAFPVPGQNTPADSLTYTLKELTTTSAAIEIEPNQYIMLLAVDGGIIKAYANILVDSSKVKPEDAPTVVGYVLEKGSAEGTTRFKYLDIATINGATQWMYYKQSTGLTEAFGINTSAPGNAAVYNYSLSPKPDISVNVNDHIILLAVDSAGSRKIKAYADILVTSDLIQTPYAYALQRTTDYTGPIQGADPGTTAFTLLDTNVPEKGGKTVVWKYKTGTQQLARPHLDEEATTATGYSDILDANKITIEPNNWILMVATIDDKVKASFQEKVTSDNIQPKEAPALAPNNYSVLVAGTQPGTTKFPVLNSISLTGFNRWEVKVYTTPQVLMQNSSFTGQWSTTGTFMDNIKVQVGQYVVLAAVNSAGNVLAYKCIQITDATQISPSGFDNNYSGPDMGSEEGTTSFIVSTNGLSGADRFIAIVDDGPQTLKTGDEITYVIGGGSDFSAYKEYTSFADIKVNPNQYVVLIAIDDTVTNKGKVVAYANILVPESKINPGPAIPLEVNKNYKLEAGTSTGTVRFTYLNKVGVPEFDGNKWVVQFENTQLTTPPILNTKLGGTPVGYTLGSNLNVSLGRYIILYAVDSTNAIKGYACIQVRPDELTVNSMPVPGSDYYTTRFDSSPVDPLEYPTLKYIVMNSSAGVILKDGTMEGLQDFAPGVDITAAENQYLLLAAVDSTGLHIEAYKEIKITAAMLELPGNSASLSGTLISAPVSESNIAAGGKTLIIKLDDGKWASDIATNTEKRNSLYDKLEVSPIVSTGDTNMWKSVIAALKLAGQSPGANLAGIERTDNSTVTIVFPQVPEYEISKNQTITLTIPKTCVVGNNDVAVGQKITIENLATATVTGAYTEEEIRNGTTKSIKITLSGTTWATDVATNSVTKNALLSGLKADNDPDNKWSELITNAKVARTSSTVVTITLTAKPDFDITANQTISVTIPTCAAIGAHFDIQASGTVTITTAAPPVVAANILSVTAAVPNIKYKLNDTITINVKFDKSVSVTGAPTISLQAVSGTTPKYKNATYVSGNGSDTLVFTYKVQSGDNNQQLEYKAGTITGTIVNAGTNTAVNKTLPPFGTASLGASNIAIDGVVPKFASGYPKAATWINGNDVNIPVKLTDIATIYYVVVPYSANGTAPTTAQIKADAAMETFDVTSANTEYAIALTGMTDNKGYTVYMYAEDSCGNSTAVTSVMLDNKPPVYSKLEVTPADFSIGMVVNVNEPGNIYVVVLPDGSAAPASLKDYTAAKVTQAVTAADVDNDITLSIGKYATSKTASAQLVPSTDYDVYVVFEDTASPTKNSSVPEKVETTTTKLDVTKVDVDLANNLILNTSPLMQYSVNGSPWTTCTATTTKVTFTFDDISMQFKVIVRETKNPANSVTLTFARGSNSGLSRSSIDYDIVNGEVINKSATNLEFRINGGDWKPLNATKTASDVVFEPGALELRTAATSPTAAGKDALMPSYPVVVDGIPERAEAPELTFDDTANKIPSLSDEYEYSVNGGSWVSGELAAGRPNEFAGTKTVLVRLKATATQLESREQEILFTANVIKVVAAPAEGTKKATVTITFEENTNKANQTLTAAQIKDWFIVGTELGVTHEWGTDISGKFNTTGNVLTITFNSMAGSTFVIGDIVEVAAAAQIQNTAKTSDYYTSKGKLGGTVPKITSIKAANNSGTRSLVITFDQATNKKDIDDPANIAKYIIATDVTGTVQRKWSIVNNANPDVTLAWSTDGKVLTVRFNNFNDTNILVNDKIRINSAWGLKDAADTSAASTSSAIINGSF